MNALFTVVFTLSAIVVIVTDPTLLLPALLDGAGAAATLSVALISSYAAWLGVMRLWEESGVTRAISKFLKPLSRKLFRVNDGTTLSAIGMNLSANLLGIGGAATPYGIKAVSLLQNAPDSKYSSAMLFVLNATSLQLIPTSVVAVRIAAGSAAPADVIFPTVLCTLFSTLLGGFLVWLVYGKKSKTRGAGLRSPKIAPESLHGKRSAAFPALPPSVSPEAAGAGGEE